MEQADVVVVGGGAAGFFGAITCAEAVPGLRVLILEKGSRVLSKVEVSGGGRCNVTHHCFEPRELVKNYPRGGRELIGAFHRWQPSDTVAWFEGRGVALKAEADGRMFPVTDRSRTIMDCLQGAATGVGVEVRLGTGVGEVKKTEEGFLLNLGNGSEIACRKLLLATGGAKAGSGTDMAVSLGHTVVPPVPSLFTFNVKDRRIDGLAGISVADAEASVPSMELSRRGPVLVTHWGLSGPGILKLSAWGARLMHGTNYRFELVVNWLPGRRVEEVRENLVSMRENIPGREVAKASPFAAIPQRLWARLVAEAGIGEKVDWSHLNREGASTLASQLTACTFAVDGKSTNKEEFVTCGGVSLKEVDFKTMESRLVPGLHFAGEVLDIDGVTGGFNFQAAWTTGRLAGLHMAESLES